jgi:hypothetical protein
VTPLEDIPADFCEAMVGMVVVVVVVVVKKGWVRER